MPRPMSSSPSKQTVNGAAWPKFSRVTQSSVETQTCENSSLSPLDKPGDATAPAPAITIRCIMRAQGNVGARGTNWPSFPVVLGGSSADDAPLSSSTFLTRDDNDRCSLS